MFPDAKSNAYTTTELRGAKGVAASSYGNPITYTPEDRASRAFDGDLGDGVAHRRVRRRAR